MLGKHNAQPTMSIFSSIALDLGSTSIKSGLLDNRGMLCHIQAQLAPIIVAEGGRYESDALAYVEVAEQVLGACIAQCGSERPPLGISSQRSSFLIWERASGQPITPLISWQDNRGAASCATLQPHEELICALTGLRLTPYYFAPKLCVVLQAHPEWRKRLLRGELLVGTLDTFLIWRWSDGAHHVTDASMAARTLLMDIRQSQWSPELCALFEIPLAILPRINSSAGLNLKLSNGLTLQASVGDQSAALISSIATNSNEALVNLGTGGFVIRYLDDKPSKLPGYLNTLVYQNAQRHTHLAIEGTLNSIADALVPYPINECQTTDLATQNTFCLAEPSGIGAPYFRNDIGLRYSSSIDHLTPRQIAALLLEAIIFRVARILEEFHRESAIERAYLSGGLSELVCLQQGIAQCVPFSVYRLKQKEGSLQGAALLASGVEVTSHVEAEQIIVTSKNELLPEKYRRWKVWLDGVLGL